MVICHDSYSEQQMRRTVRSLLLSLFAEVLYIKNQICLLLKMAGYRVHRVAIIWCRY